MKIANYDYSSIAGGIKDIAGTIIAVVMLIVAFAAYENTHPQRAKLNRWLYN